MKNAFSFYFPDRKKRLNRNGTSFTTSWRFWWERRTQFMNVWLQKMGRGHMLLSTEEEANPTESKSLLQPERKRYLSDWGCCLNTLVGRVSTLRTDNWLIHSLSPCFPILKVQFSKHFSPTTNPGEEDVSCKSRGRWIYSNFCAFLSFP